MLTHYRWLAAGIALPIVLSGCATEYACPIPQGDGGCRSVAQVYQDTLGDTGSMTPSAGGTPSTDASAKPTATTAAATSTAAVPVLKPANPGDAVLSMPRVLRLDFMPWRDSDDDLQGGGFVYLRLDRGQWTIAPKQ
jgi:conjugal transfer pilus assembly protein TraV